MKPSYANPLMRPFRARANAFTDRWVRCSRWSQLPTGYLHLPPWGSSGTPAATTLRQLVQRVEERVVPQRLAGGAAHPGGADARDEAGAQAGHRETQAQAIAGNDQD